MDVPLGGVHGFLGPNGAGKTTTLRVIAGLARANSGSIRILGRTMPRRLSDVIGRMGIIVESPHFQEAFSGRLNLELLARSIGVHKRRVGEVLAETRLTDRGDDRVKTYSLGMKQRLSIAAAMLKNPDIYIFDEPTNGLDPQGIREIRRTIRDLGTDGRTVLVSSHILSEVEQFADTVTIIGRGRVMAEGSVDELRWGQSPVLEIGVSDLSQGASLLRQLGLRVRTRDYLLLVDNPPPAERVSKHLAVHGLYVTHLSLQRSSLEDAYFELTESAALGGTDEPLDLGPPQLGQIDRDLWRPAEVDTPAPVERAEDLAQLDPDTLAWLEVAGDTFRTDTIRRGELDVLHGDLPRLGSGVASDELSQGGGFGAESRIDGFGESVRLGGTGELPGGTGELPRLGGTGEPPVYDETFRVGGIPPPVDLGASRPGELYPASDLGVQRYDIGEPLYRDDPGLGGPTLPEAPRIPRPVVEPFYTDGSVRPSLDPVRPGIGELTLPDASAAQADPSELFRESDADVIPRRGDTGQFSRYQGDEVPRRARRALPDPEEYAE